MFDSQNKPNQQNLPTSFASAEFERAWRQNLKRRTRVIQSPNSPGNLTEKTSKQVRNEIQGCQPVCASVKPAGQCAMQAWEALSCPSDSWSNIRDDQQLWYNLFSSFYKFTFQAEYPDLLLILHIPAFLHTHPLHQPFLKQLGMNQIWNFCDGRLKYKRLCVLVASALLCLSCVSVVSLRVHQLHHPLHVSLCHPPVGTHAIVWHRTEPDPPLYYYFFCTNPPFLFILLLCMCFNSALCQSCRRKCFPEKIFTLHCKIVLVCTYHLLVVLIWSKQISLCVEWHQMSRNKTNLN